MKKYRAIIPVILIAALAASWYVLISDAGKQEELYQSHLSVARRYAQDGLTRKAIENYEAALQIRATPEIYGEIIDYYKQQKNTREYLVWCEQYMETYPKNPEAYEGMLEVYYEEQDYESCYDVILLAEQKKVSSPRMEEIEENIRYAYTFGYSTYADVGIYSNNYCPVRKKKNWGYVDRFGIIRLSSQYQEAGYFTQSGYAPIIDAENKVYFIDKSGEKVIGVSGEYKRFGILVGDIFPAEKSNGKYVYLRQNTQKAYFASGDNTSGVHDSFVEVSDEFDFASAFNQEMAAVQKNGQWEVINLSFEQIGSNYADVKLDEKQIAVRNGVYFAAETKGQYKMYNSSGKPVNDQIYEDVKLFLGEEPTAVKAKGRWYFIDSQGNALSDKTYDDARPFSNGLAAVCNAGQWGFVDQNETVVITEQFADSKDFNAKGSCFVKVGDEWQLLKLYRLNREG